MLFLLVAAWLVSGGVCAAPVPVLIVHSYNLEYPWTKRQHEGFVQALRANTAVDPAISTESLDTKRYPYDARYARTFADFLRFKYAGFRPSLIYVTDDDALLFAREHLAGLFPDSPVFFSGVNDFSVRAWLDPARMTGVFEKKEIAPNLALLRQLDAEARRIVLVGDGGGTYRSIEREARRDLARYPEIAATFVAAPTIETLLETLRRRPEKYLVLTTLGGLTDAAGRLLPLKESISRIVALNRFVILSMEDVYQFDGVLGGFVTSGERQGESAAALALAFLRGAPLPSIAPQLLSPNHYLIDARELARNGLVLPARLPGAVVVVNQPSGFIDRHRESLLLAIYLLAAALFVVVLASLWVATRNNRELRSRALRIEAQSASLRESEATYRALFEASVDALYLLDPESGLFVDCNEAVLRLHGLDSREQLIGRTPESLSPEFQANGACSKDLANAYIQQAFTTGSATFEWVHCASDGSSFPVLVSLCAFWLKGKKLILAIARDISAQKSAEAELRVAAIAFESQEAIIIADENKLIQRVNPAFTKVTGYAAAEVIGRTPEVLKSGRQDSAYYQAMWSAVREHGEWRGEIWNRRKSGDVYPEWLTITAVKDAAGKVVNYVGMFQDITERKLAEEKIRNLAFYDALTQLPNRRLLLDRLHQAIAIGSRGRHHGALLFIDLDNFKLLNDTQGHDIGDLLLIQVAQRLQACVREGDTVSRLGGDEFVVMLENLDESPAEAANQAETVAVKVLELLNLPYELGVIEHHGTPSIGVALFRDKSDAVADPLKRADLAMYQAKAGGRNTIRFFDPAMQAAVEARSHLEAELRRAIPRGEFILRWQPQVAPDGRVTGVEALVRWLHPERGLIAPQYFIALAEETGLIIPIGLQVLQQACEQFKIWAGRVDSAHLSISVNVSARQFHHPDFIDMVEAALDAAQADGHGLVLEITESLLLENVDEVVLRMHALKARGLRFSIDDFGTGYSSLSYLKRLPLDELKIDRSFVEDIEHDANAAAICAAFISLTHILGLKVVAEGVETEAQRHLLSSVHRCDTLQGYLFGKPMSAIEIDRMLRDREIEMARA
ncbi:MAG: EAL domain-containing protein [Pseudomonadota bacterium]|nr:EAL domain-containing protein [Pseudomonadota bacterium]MDP1905949.1 EAL domain-containing protein [Pseudomonadota bacterium]MDP2351867.1 EAL domain-containing protein [Pseudomonadota bacterium]